MEPGAAPSPPSLVSDVKAAYARSRAFQVVVLLGGAVIAGSAAVRLFGDHLFLALFMSIISVVSFVMVGQLLFTGVDPDDDDGDDDEDDDFWASRRSCPRGRGDVVPGRGRSRDLPSGRPAALRTRPVAEVGRSAGAERA